MIYCYPVINGEKVRHSFFEDWSEVPFSRFIEWQKIAIKLDDLTPKLKDLFTKLYDIAEKIVLESNVQLKEKLEKQLNKLQSKIKALQRDERILQCEGISLFCSVPMSVLINMDTREQNLNDNCLEAYKARLSYLVTQKLPTDAINEFHFQSETDEEIKDLESKYNSLNMISKLCKTGKKLRAKIEKAKKATYKINDIWMQSTFANMELQAQANRVIEAINNDDFEELIYLISMLTIEGATDSTILKNIKESNFNSYLETYKAEFIKLYKKREEIFTQQVEKLSVETVLKIKNFFLSN